MKIIIYFGGRKGKREAIQSQFWTLSIVLSFILNTTFWETRFCLRLQVEPTQLGPMVRASLCLRSEDRTQSPKRHVLNKEQDDE
jgi:hypothetical protein